MVPAAKSRIPQSASSPPCYHFATELLSIGQDRVVSDNQRRTAKPNEISQIHINDDN